MDNEQQFQQLKSEVEGIKSNLLQISSLVNHLNTQPSTLDRNIDPDTRDTITRVNQDTYKQVSVVVGATFTLFPQSKYIKVSGTVARTSSSTLAIANGTWYGQPLIIEGTDNTKTITFKDAANTQLTGDCVLGIYDTLTLIWDGTYWLEVSRSINSGISSSTSINARSYGNTTTIADSTDTKVSLSANSFANGVTWDSTNKRLTVITPGQYMVTAYVQYDSAAGGDGKIYQVMIFKNNSEQTRVNVISGTSGVAIGAMSTDIYDCVANDYFEVWTAQYTGVNRSIANNTETAYLLIAKV